MVLLTSDEFPGPLTDFPDHPSSSGSIKLSITDRREALRQRLEERLQKVSETERRLRLSLSATQTREPVSPPKKSSPILFKSPSRKAVPPAADCIIVDSARARAAAQEEQRLRKEAALSKQKQQLEAEKKSERLARVLEQQKRALLNSPKRKPQSQPGTPHTPRSRSVVTLQPPSPAAITPTISPSVRHVTPKSTSSEKQSIRDFPDDSVSGRRSSHLSLDQISRIRTKLSEVRASKIKEKEGILTPRGSRITIKQSSSVSKRSKSTVKSPIVIDCLEDPVDFISSPQPKEQPLEPVLEHHPVPEAHPPPPMPSKEPERGSIEEEDNDSAEEELGDDESVHSFKSHGDHFTEESNQLDFNQIDGEISSDAHSEVHEDEDDDDTHSLPSQNQSVLIEDSAGLPTDPFDQSELLGFISDGSELLKYNAEGKAHKRFFVMVPEECTIYWGKSPSQKTLKTATITELRFGHPSNVFLPLSFTLKLLGGELMVLSALDERSFVMWTKGIQLVLDHIANF
ncbi:hypothetical protein RCL1_004191 [Eukaryota sp. TZLM3-RCL]